MLSLLINKFKKVLTILLIGMLLLTGVKTAEAKTNEYISYTFGGYTIQSTVDNEESIPTWAIRETQVVLRIGEFQNKQGKRVYLSDIGLYSKDIPSDIKIHYDDEGSYIHEYDLNKKIATRIYEELKANGVNVILQDTKDRTEDLNRAGRIANKSNANIYLSIHTNYYDSNSKGFFIMTNEGDTTARNIADRLSSSIENNGMIPRREPMINGGYCGEMNEIHNSTIALLLEAGFYSNPDELKHLMSNEYSNYIAEHLADEIQNVLNDYWK